MSGKTPIAVAFGKQLGNDVSHRAVPESLTARTLDGLTWMISGSVVRTASQMLVVVAFARMLTPAEFGLMGAAMVVVGLSQVLSRLGVGPAIVQLGTLRSEHIRQGFTLSLALGFFFASIIFVTAPVTAAFFQMPDLVPVLKVLSIGFGIRSLATVAESLLQRELNFRALAAIDVISVVFGYGLFGIVLAISGFGVWSLVMGQLAQTVIQTGGTIVARRHCLVPLISRTALKDILTFGGGFSLAKLAVYVATQGDNFIVGRCLGPAALGIYGRAYQFLVTPAVLLGTVANKVLFAAMSQIQDQPNRLRRGYRCSLSLMAIVIVPATAILIIVAPELVRVLLGRQWHSVIVPFQILSVGFLFRTSYGLSAAVSQAAGAVYSNAWRASVHALTVVLGAWLGQAWGVSGVAVGVVGALFINFLLSAQLNLALTGLTAREFLICHFPAFMLASIAGTVAWLITQAGRLLNWMDIFVLTSGSFGALIALAAILVLRPSLTGADASPILAAMSKRLIDRLWRLRMRGYTAKREVARIEGCTPKV